MTGSNDDTAVIETFTDQAPILCDRTVEALLAGRGAPGHTELAERIRCVRAVALSAAPPPNAELAKVLAGGLMMPSVKLSFVATPPQQGRRWASRVGVAIAALVTSTAIAGAANALPAPLQTAVANAVEAVTPFQLPKPGGTVQKGSRERSEQAPPDPSSAPPVAPFTPSAPAGPSAPPARGPVAAPEPTRAGDQERDDSGAPNSSPGPTDGPADPTPGGDEPAAAEPEEAAEPAANEPKKPKEDEPKRDERDKDERDKPRRPTS